MASDTPSYITIDGSTGEGGGQILRSSLALSAITGKGVRIINIRAKRPKPGLANQHLTAVRAAATVSRGKLTGDAVGSTELTFTPGPHPPEGGKFRFDIGSAGSGTLVLQTVLPILLCATGTSVVEVGSCGTHNPLAPPFEFLKECFFPQLDKMGAHVDFELLKHGFYPAGGGCIQATIYPISDPKPFSLLERGALAERSVVATVANMPQTVADTQAAEARKALKWSGPESESRRLKHATGSGNYVMAKAAYEHVCEIATGFSDRGVSAAAVAVGAAADMSRYLESDAPVGEHLADQLLLPLAVAAGGVFRTTVASTHLTTNIDTVNTFLGPIVSMRELGPNDFEVTVAATSLTVRSVAGAGAKRA